MTLKSRTRWLLLLTACACAATAHARPRIIEESQRLEAPQAGLSYFADSVAIDGDWALVTALYSADGSFEYPYRQLALLYRREDDRWVYDRELVDDVTDESSWNDPKVALKNGLAAVSTSPLRVFRLTPSGWTASNDPFPAAPSGTAWANGLTRIDGNTVAAISGKCNYGVITNEYNAGNWRNPLALVGNARICSLPNYSGSMDIDGNTLAFTNPQEEMERPASLTRIYQRSAPGGGWQLQDTLPAGNYGYGIAVRGDELFLGSWDPQGNEIYRRVNGQWEAHGHLPVVDGFSTYYDGASHFAKSGEFILAPTPRHEETVGGIGVWRRNGDSYEQVAVLQSSQGDWLGPSVEISGRTVIVSGQGATFDAGRLYFFELPEDLSAPAEFQDDFENGSSRWDVETGNFALTRRPATRVLYQSDLANQATAVFTGSAAGNQSVQADVKPRGFSGADRWVGVATRYTNASNYYFLTLRSSDRVQLRRMRNGTVTTLGSVPLDVSVNHTYRLRLESIGTRHRVFVDDVPLLDVRDTTLDSGSAALLTFRASADFDNVVVTPTGRTVVYNNTLDGTWCRSFVQEFGLRVSGTPKWDCEDYDAGYLRQASSEGVARGVLGPDTDDQVVESRVMPESYADTGNQDKWIGLIARYQDENNYYYLTLRSSNAISLRKLVNGQITELDTAAVPAAAGEWHDLKLEAVGNRIRAFVDGVQLLEAVDASHPSGAQGIITWRTVGRFDYLKVLQP